MILNKIIKSTIRNNWKNQRVLTDVEQSNAGDI